MIKIAHIVIETNIFFFSRHRSSPAAFIHEFIPLKVGDFTTPSRFWRLSKSCFGVSSYILCGFFKERRVCR